MAKPAQKPRHEDWEYMTRRANMCFQAQSLSLASKYYHKALSLAYSLVHIPEEYKHSIIAIAISHHNLADFFVKKNNALLAGQHLDQAHDFMLNEFYQAKCCHTKREIMRILNITRMEINKFQQTFGTV